MATAMTDKKPAQSKLWKPPIVGIITFLLMFVAIGLAHTMMLMIEHNLGHELTLKLSPLLGFVGIVMLWYGIKSKSENFQTWIGFFAGVVVWMCWVEFFYMWYGRNNWGMLPRMDGPDGLHVSGTWPEYMIMASTVGTLMMMLCFYTFDKDTRCNMFIWFQNKLGLKEGLGPSTKTARDRNYAIITFMEVFFVTWFCYAWNLLTFDPGLFGNQGESNLFMAVNMGSVFVATIWSGYCMTRLIKFKRTSTALRYAIPVGNIFWVNVEILSKFGMLTEIWVDPWSYTLEMTVIFAAFVVLIVLLLMAPKKPSEVGKWKKQSAS